MSTTDTTTTSAAAPPAAWYPDPTGRHRLRWWDGEGWTQRVADRTEGEADAPEPEPTPVEPPAEPLEPVDHAAAEAAAMALIPVPERELEPLFPGDQPDTAIEAASTEQHGGDAIAEFEPQKKSSVPPAERASTGAGLSTTPNRKGLFTIIGVTLVVALAGYWGWSNYESADRWRDRGEALQDELDTRNSNSDAFEQALNEAASRGARLADSQQQMGELRGATEATITQLNQCVAVLNDLLGTTANGGDPTSLIDRANQVCGQAGANGEELIRILDALQLT